MIMVFTEIAIECYESWMKYKNVNKEENPATKFEGEILSPSHTYRLNLGVISLIVVDDGWRTGVRRGEWTNLQVGILEIQTLAPKISLCVFFLSVCACLFLLKVFYL